MAQRKKHEQKGAPPWLVSMGDMNNLLMCFFIVLMGDISVVTQEEFYLTMSSFKGNLGILTGGKSLSPGKLSELGHNMMALPSKDKGKTVGKQMKRALEVFKPEIQSKYVRVMEDERGLVITLASDAFFDTGSAALKEDIRPVLKKVSEIIRPVNNFVRIEGHTDNNPITVKKGYKTNWELSGARSINILRYLSEEEKIPPAQLSAVAFGQYRPVDDNNTPEGRAYNRRVDIVILKEKFVEDKKIKGISRPLPDEEWR